ncbi:diaminopimelate epimerase [Arabiibacter massiliensis]|uniref:diaminopimelate epimerase n=1 Tax=Arabiibacter massiliensis TaxID=1870985 RepID=UPI0009BC1FE6|nr:diaminopimelate epimerase [Arabiibacter massiliensis]
MRQRLEFVKMHGLGNDFVMLDGLARAIELDPHQVKRLCDRHFGVGADGVIVVQPSTRPECAAYMHYINADGTLAQMCGNGVRCFAKFLVDRGYVAAEDGRLVADTLAGPRPLSFTVDGEGKMACATVDMGRPVLEPARVPVSAPSDAAAPFGEPYVGSLELESSWGPFAFTCVSMGNPHAVCFLEEVDLDAFDVDEVGAFFEAHPAFPEKTNVEFAVVGPRGISMRVYERGCGETLACGTGACATAVAACLTGRAGCESDVLLRGGTLHVAWGDDGHVMMTGPAAESFAGTVNV